MQDYLKIACELGRDFSTDPTTQNGAIIVRDGQIISRGFNYIPEGVNGTWEKVTKYLYVEHAERDAIYKAARHGVATAGTTMYCPYIACSDCARAIIISGITQVYGLQKTFDLMPERWRGNVLEALKMLKDANVGVTFADVVLGVTIRFDGKLVDL